MSSLYNRATPSQAAILRVVEGAVKNAQDAHPDLKISLPHRRSIAKRAAGTLTAQWPDVLALQERQMAMASHLGHGPSEASDLVRRYRRRGSQMQRLSPLRTLEKLIARDIRGLKPAGQSERVEAFIHVLRLISTLRQAEGGG